VLEGLPRAPRDFEWVVRISDEVRLRRTEVHKQLAEHPTIDGIALTK
jgi:hypothetical protein